MAEAQTMKLWIYCVKTLISLRISVFYKICGELFSFEKHATDSQM